MPVDNKLTRRPTGPAPVGGSGWGLEGRVTALEDEQRALAENVGGMAGSLSKVADGCAALQASVDRLTLVIQGPAHKPEEGLLVRMLNHDKRWGVFAKLCMSFLLAGTALSWYWLGKIAWMVQSSRLPPGSP